MVSILNYWSRGRALIIPTGFLKAWFQTVNVTVSFHSKNFFLSFKVWSKHFNLTIWDFMFAYIFLLYCYYEVTTFISKRSNFKVWNGKFHWRHQTTIMVIKKDFKNSIIAKLVVNLLLKYIFFIFISQYYSNNFWWEMLTSAKEKGRPRWFLFVLAIL